MLAEKEREEKRGIGEPNIKWANESGDFSLHTQ